MGIISSEICNLRACVAQVKTHMSENPCPGQGSAGQEAQGNVGCSGEHTKLNQTRIAILLFLVHVAFSS